MTPSENCKSHGITLKQLIAATGDSHQNLHAMNRSNPRRFELLCKGAYLEIFSREQINKLKAEAVREAIENSRTDFVFELEENVVNRDDLEEYASKLDDADISWQRLPE